MSQQVLNADTFASPAIVGDRTRTMTYSGTIAKAMFFLVLTVACAIGGWNAAEGAEPTSGLWFFLGYIFLLALTFAAADHPRIAAVAGVLYALLLGTWMGAISRVYEEYYDGVVGAAIGVTLTVFLATLLLYSTRAIRVTPRFVAVISISIFGILLLYLTGWIFSLFGVELNFLHSPTPVGIGLQIVIAIVAALSLTLDFSVIETGVNQHAAKDYEWYAAFGLQTTLVWLYLEILRLLVLLSGDN